MIVLLALDMAGLTGWARWREGQEMAPFSGAARIADKRRGTLGSEMAAFRDWLSIEILQHGVTHVCAESVYVNEKSASAADRLFGLHGVAQELCHRKGVIWSTAMSGDWRHHFLGQRTAPKTIPAKKRRDWWKRQAVLECEKRGWKVSNADQAEALGILVYERARLLPTWGCEGDLFSVAAMNTPLGMELVRG